MKSYNFKWAILFLFVITYPALPQSNFKIWTETTVQDFSDSQLYTVVVKNNFGGEVTLPHPLVKTTKDYMNNLLLRHIAKDSAGNFVRAWNGEDGNIYVKKYAADGREITKTIKVNEGNGHIHSNSTSIAILKNGTYMVVWRNYGDDEYLYGQIYVKDSVKEGNNFRIDDGVVSWGDGYPLANNIEHNFLIFYTVRVNYPDDKLYIQKRDTYGNQVGEIKRLNKESFTNFEYKPRVIPDDNGYWISWNGYSQDENLNTYKAGSYMRHFKIDGTPLSDVIFVSSNSQSNTSLGLSLDLHLLVAWDELNNIGDGYDILGQLYDSAGVPVGNTLQLNSIYSNNQDPDIEFKNNEFQVTWWSNNLTYVTSFKYDPKFFGEMVSSVFDGSPEGCSFDEISWDHKINPASELIFQLKSANTIEQLNNSIWYGPTSSSDFYTGYSGETINNVHNGNRYIQYKAYFTSEYGNSAELKSVSVKYIPYDTIPPQPPLNLTAANNHVNVFLNWQPSTDNDVAVYKIYRGVESHKYDETWYRIIPKNLVSYIDSSAQIGKMYYYAVTAIDSSHNESSYSNEALMMFSGITVYVSTNGSSSGSGSINDPVKTIQQGMNLASSGDTLRVMPGVYNETFSSKYRVSLIGAGADQCIINSQITATDDCIIKGFTISGSINCEQGAPIITENIIIASGYAIYLSAFAKNSFSSAVITKNFITGSGCSIGIFTNNYVLNPIIKNNIIKAKDVGIDILYGGNPEITNNTIIVSAHPGSSIFLSAQIPCKVENNIFQSELGISSYNELASVFNYNDSWSGTPANLQLPITNISVDPIFVNADIQDYHLLSNSRCRDAGNPNPSYNDIDGTRNDIGAYGGPDPFNMDITSQLTRSISVSSLSGYPDDTVSVYVSMNKTAGLAKADFMIEYDNALLSFQNAKLTEATAGFNLEHQILSSQEIKFSLSSSLSAAGNLKDILQLSFIVNPNSKTDDASPLTIKNVALFDTTSKEIILTSLTNGAFVVNNTKESENYIYVDANNSGVTDGSRKFSFKTITVAINSASAGDSIWVAGGNYHESLTMKEGISLIGSGSSVTNIIGAGDNFGVLFNNITHGEISGFTFKSDDVHFLMSAFIICQASSPIIKKNRFDTELIQNIAVECSNNSNAVIEDNYFNGADITTYESSPVIRNNFIQNFLNGITCFQNSNPSIIGNKITGSEGPNVISILNSGSLIKNNFIYCKSWNNGISLYKATNVKVYNNIIKGNGSSINGMEIYETQNTDIINNTIVTNKIGINETSSTLNILNNIIVNNSGYGVKLSESSGLDYNAFWNNSADYEALNPGINNIHADILFADTSKENYRLLPNSPCINAGNPDSKYNDIDGTRNDIGAYGGPYADSSWIILDSSSLAIDQVTEKDTIQILISGEKVKGIAGINLTLSYDPTVLTLISANSSELTKSFSIENTNHKSGLLNLTLNSFRGINEDQGELIKLQFAAHSLQTATTTTLHFDSVSVWDETARAMNIFNLKDGQLTILTGINSINNELPTSYSLSQNFPNPFNPLTKIRYELPLNSKVTIKIYDILGREVTTLLSETLKAGKYEVEWDATRCASGVYFYRLQAGSFVETKKMLLLR